MHAAKKRGASPYLRQGSLALVKSRSGSRRRRSEFALRRGPDVSGIERQPGERQPADQIADHGRNFIPDEIVQDREMSAHDQRRREKEHVDNGMLEYHGKE